MSDFVAAGELEELVSSFEEINLYDLISPTREYDNNTLDAIRQLLPKLAAKSQQRQEPSAKFDSSPVPHRPSEERAAAAGGENGLTHDVVPPTRRQQGRAKLYKPPVPRSHQQRQQQQQQVHPRTTSSCTKPSPKPLASLFYNGGNVGCEAAGVNSTWRKEKLSPPQLSKTPTESGGCDECEETESLDDFVFVPLPPISFKDGSVLLPIEEEWEEVEQLSSTAGSVAAVATTSAGVPAKATCTGGSQKPSLKKGERLLLFTSTSDGKLVENKEYAAQASAYSHRMSSGKASSSKN